MITEIFWTDYIHDIQSFHYEFKIKVNMDNWKDKVIAFDEHFLKMGKKYKLFYYKNVGFDIYDNQSTQQCYNEEDNIISLGMFSKLLHKKDKSFLDAYIDLPKMKGNKVVFCPTCYHQPFVNLKIISFSYEALFVEELLRKEETDFELALLVSSSSNIWWEEIEFTMGTAHNIGLSLSPPVDNRRFAYKMTPRLNSFLRDLRKKTEQLGGTMRLQEDYVKKYVTMDGVLLDGEIKYE